MAHSFTPLNEYSHNKKFRVLSLDAGGIYGLFTARMLEKMCRQNKDFLADDQVTMFAGTSAGAIIALLLAQQKKPRDAVLNGTISAFFQDPLVYTNSRSLPHSLLSLGLLTPWSGSRDFRTVLEKYFGNTKMKELPHRVLIPTFDFFGDPELPTRERSWKPKIYYNFPDDEMDREAMVKDVAYGAASPAALRAIFRGISDGGIYAPEPALCALAKIIQQMRRIPEEERKRLLARDIEQVERAIECDLYGEQSAQQSAPAVPETVAPAAPDEDAAAEKAQVSLDHLLHEKIIILSMGVGGRVPSYWLRNIDLGALPFNMLPTNVGTSDLFPPIFQLLLSSPTEAITYQCKQLMGGVPEYGKPDMYYRLNPKVIDFPVPPVIPAAGLARFAPMRRFIVKRIDEDANVHYVDDQITKTLAWLKDVKWLSEPPKNTTRRSKHH